MTYAQKLKDPRWQKKRLEVMERDGWKCSRCQATGKTLAVHHLFYEKDKEPWESSSANLTTLCEECHTAVQEAQSVLRELPAVIHSQGYDLVEVAEIVKAMFASGFLSLSPENLYAVKFYLGFASCRELENLAVGAMQTLRAGATGQFGEFVIANERFTASALKRSSAAAGGAAK